MLDKLEEKLKVGLNNVNVTQNDATSPSPAALSINKTNVMNKLDGTNVQVCNYVPAGDQSSRAIEGASNLRSFHPSYQ